VALTNDHVVPAAGPPARHPSSTPTSRPDWSTARRPSPSTCAALDGARPGSASTSPSTAPPCSAPTRRAVRCVPCDITSSLTRRTSPRTVKGQASPPSATAWPLHNHHAADDCHVLGIRPDPVVEMRADLLAEVDGPMPEHGLKSRHGQRLMALPGPASNAPTPRGSTVAPCSGRSADPACPSGDPAVRIVRRAAVTSGQRRRSRPIYPTAQATGRPSTETVGEAPNHPIPPVRGPTVAPSGSSPGRAVAVGGEKRRGSRRR
jgi:hypothetical protein